MSAEQAKKGRQRGGRAARKSARAKSSGLRVPYIQRRIATYDILGEEGLCLIEDNADTILQETGMEFRDDPEVLDVFRAAGADVKGERVRFDKGMCRSIVTASAPAEFMQHARNSENSIHLGGTSTVLAPGWGPPFVHDLDRGRRYATLEDFEDLVKIHQMIPHLHHSGGVVCEPVDLPANKRHLDMLYAHIKHSDRAFFGALIGEERAADSVAIAKILFGDDFVDTNCCLYAVSNTNAPLVMDSRMSGALKVYARHNQAVAVTPWTLAGAMSPCTVAGTLAQVLAEVLGGLALHQLVNPGAPCLMGSFASTISMQSGAPTFGMPESGKMVLAAAQLARRLGVPFHTVGALSSSKIPDAQAEQEATQGLLMSILAGAHFINHATGWLEGGLVNGFEKTIIDADLCGNMIEFAKGIDLSDNAQAMDAIREIGPGHHYLGASHTLQNFETAMFRPRTNDANSYEQWLAAGALDAGQRANAIWKQLLADYERPPLDPAIDEALRDYIAKRKESMPDAEFY